MSGISTTELAKVGVTVEMAAILTASDLPILVKEALEKRPNTRVVFVSGYAEDVLDTQQAAIPNSVFLPKPFSLDDLTETVQQQFH